MPFNLTFLGVFKLVIAYFAAGLCITLAIAIVAIAGFLIYKTYDAHSKNIRRNQ